MDLQRSSTLFNIPDRTVPPYYWVEHIPFAFYLVDTLRPSLIVELGVHSGNSFNAFCQAVKETGLNCRCFGIDNWQGDQHTGSYTEVIYEDLKKYQEEQKYTAFAHLVRSDFDQALNLFEDGSIDLLHIDGCHIYEAVKNDFFNWLPRLSKKSVVLFHDTQGRNKDFGVWRLWEELTREYASIEFKNSGGLGVLKTGTDISLPLFGYTDEEKDFFTRLVSRIGAFLKARIVLKQIHPEIEVKDVITVNMMNDYKRLQERF